MRRASVGAFVAKPLRPARRAPVPQGETNTITRTPLHAANPDLAERTGPPPAAPDPVLPAARRRAVTPLPLTP